MRDGAILDEVVRLAGDDAAVDEVVFGAMGPAVNDASSPDTRHARYVPQLVKTCRVDIDARVRRGSDVRAGLGLGRLISEAGQAWRMCAS